MTNHWRDIRHADLVMINGANPAEAHPVGFQWMMRAKLERGAKIIHVDPRFTRTSAVADLHLRIRTGTDVAYFGGLINYVLQNGLYHAEYVAHATNAAFVVKQGYGFSDGLFNGYDPQTRLYDPTLWAYETGADGFAKTDVNHPRSVLNLMRKHYRRYTPEMVARITGIPADQFLEVADLVGQMGKPDKVMTIVYAVGLTHHTTGGQLIRSGAVLQLLLGNMGRPGGGMNAERGHANIQGNTDHAISWEILPGYLKIPAPGQKTIADYVAQSAPKKSDKNSWNFFGTNYSKFMVSTLKGWFGDAAKKENEFAFNFIPKPAGNASWMTIYDQALKGKMEGLILSGMTAASIGPDSGQVRHDHCILADLFQRVKRLYQGQGGKFPDPILALTFDYKDPSKPELDEIAKEINGKDLTTGKQMTSFALLKDDGTTTTGDWIYTGSYLDAGNLMKRRGGIQDPKANDPTGMGFYPSWAWSWPLNRRVMY